MAPLVVPPLGPPKGTTAGGGEIIYYSAILDLELHGLGRTLRFVDPKMGTPLPTSKELADAEKKRAEASEKELSRLREELSRLQGKTRQ